MQENQCEENTIFLWKSYTTEIHEAYRRTVLDHVTTGGLSVVERQRGGTSIGEEVMENVTMVSFRKVKTLSGLKSECMFWLNTSNWVGGTYDNQMALAKMFVTKVVKKLSKLFAEVWSISGCVNYSHEKRNISVGENHEMTSMELNWLLKMTFWKRCWPMLQGICPLSIWFLATW